MPTVGVAVALIGAAMVGAKVLSERKGDVSPDKEPEATTTLGKNATELGYEQVPEGTDLQPGQMSVSTDENGQIVGHMVVTEGGQTIYQSTNGDVRTEGPIEFDTAETPVPHVMTAPGPGAQAQPGIPAKPGMKAPMTNATRSFPAPKRAITASLRDARIAAMRRQGFTFRL